VKGGAKWRCGDGELSVHQSMKIRNSTVFLYSVLFSSLLLSQLLYYYLDYLRLINGIYIATVSVIVL
jgi:hypothetical protein